MSLLGRAISRLVPTVVETLPKLSSARATFGLQQSAVKTFSCLSSPSSVKLTQARVPCACGCGTFGRHMSTKDKELSEFLAQEISEEKKSLIASPPAKLDGFAVKGDRSELVLTKKFNDEEITVTLGVNHSVDAEGEAEMSHEGEDVELKSRPSFEVDIKKGSKVVSFTCSFITPEADPQGAGQDVVEDLFGINEITIYEGEWTEETYCVSGDILDPNLYDLLLKYLEERGVSEEFAEKLSTLCSQYEHALYVGLLQSLHTFVK